MERERLIKDLKHRKETEVDFVKRVSEKIVKHLETEEIDIVAKDVAALVESLQYYTTFLEATSSLLRDDYDFLQLHTVFGRNLLINPNHIMAVRDAEDGRGCATMVGGEWYYTFNSYNVMQENINNCYERYRRAYGEAKQQIKEIKKGNNG